MKKTKMMNKKKIPWLFRIALTGIFFFGINMASNWYWDAREGPETFTTTTTLSTTTTTTESMEEVLQGVFEILSQANVYLRTDIDGSSEIGSGVIIGVDETSYFILTCAHVVDGDGEEILSTMAKTVDGVDRPFEVVAIDVEKDLAVVSINKEGLDSFLPLFIQTSTPESNEMLVAIGNPYGSIGTIQLTSYQGVIVLQELDVARQAIILSGDLFPGMSGGSVADLSGELIGINAWELAGTGYAIPTATIIAFLDSNQIPYN